MIISIIIYGVYICVCKKIMGYKKYANGCNKTSKHITIILYSIAKVCKNLVHKMAKRADPRSWKPRKPKTSGNNRPNKQQE